MFSDADRMLGWGGVSRSGCRVEAQEKGTRLRRVSRQTAAEHTNPELRLTMVEACFPHMHLYGAFLDRHLSPVLPSLNGLGDPSPSFLLGCYHLLWPS